MPQFFTPYFFEGPKFHSRDRGTWMQHLRERQSRPPVGMNLYRLKDEYVTEQWPKIVRAQPPTDDWVEIEYKGGTIHTITEDEAALLRSFGYPMMDENT